MKKNIKFVVINGTEMLDTLYGIAAVVATFDMGCLEEYPFEEVFTEPLDAMIQLGNSEPPTNTDASGEAMRTAPVSKVLEALEKLMESGCEYRRLYPCAAMLHAFEEKRSEWDRLRVACYYY